MQFKTKVLYGLSFLILLEVVLFIKQGIYEVLFFFILLSIVYFIALLINTFGLSNDSYARGNWQGHTMNGTPLGNISITDDMLKGPEQKNTYFKIKKASNLVLLIMLVINVVCSIIALFMQGSV